MARSRELAVSQLDVVALITGDFDTWDLQRIEEIVFEVEQVTEDRLFAEFP